MKWAYFIPFAVFMVVAGFLFRGLSLDPTELPSALIEKPAPSFRLPQLTTAGAEFISDDMRGQVWVLNIWASWCAACVEEHPLFVDLAKEQLVPLIGLNYKDNDSDAMAWLNRFGNPYTVVAVDAPGRVGIDWGVYGVPETFIIDRNGVVRYKHIGPVTANDMDTVIRPKILEALAEEGGVS